MKQQQGLSPAQVANIQRRQKLNTGTLIDYEEGAIPNHNHTVTTQTITVITGVNFAAEEVTTQEITFVTAVQGVE